MICQRWRRRRDSYRPAGEPINHRWYEVAAIPDDTTARNFVVQHHYSASYVAAVRRFGLYRFGEFVGVAVYSQPWQHVVRAAGLDLDASDVVELSRFVLLDDVPANGETWFLSRARELLRPDGFAATLSFSDDAARHDASGRLVFPGHLGTIYQAFNGRYLGRGKPRTIRLLHDGTVLSDRVQTKIRRQERGWEYGIELLVRSGAERPTASENLAQWLNRWRPLITRKFRHPGCHRYIWPIDRRSRKHLPRGHAYPKQKALRPA